MGFDNVRIPRENLLNSVADVSPDGQYLSAIKDPDQTSLAIAISDDSCRSWLRRKTSKEIYVEALFTWHNMRTLQECREACGGQGLKSENRIGQMKGEYDVQSTFEGDNNVLMQQYEKGTVLITEVLLYHILHVEQAFVNTTKNKM
ncbi:hypothetical protein Tsubulata_011353 [Turnera subulata]|uniref:Acyl-CoA oxidase C-alpha1 domain-containing protein n=1 Tax=Turnera subulata TaxID=218843 RepID=A0A9Q0FQR9_9ROSI|nr:hypothetical protein Tsubulata_011353 [Turnera subulata]